MTGGAHDEHVTEALLEDDLCRNARVGAAEQDGTGMLSALEASTVLDALRGMQDLPGDEPLVAFFE